MKVGRHREAGRSEARRKQGSMRCIVPTIRHFIVTGRKDGFASFVILNEVKNLAHPTDKILRCAQDDKQGAGNRERGTGSGKLQSCGFCWV